MIKGLMLLADGFETVEALGTLDILHRTHKIEMDYVSINDSKLVTTSAGIKVAASGLLKDIDDISIYDFVVLPGGKLGVENIKNSSLAMATVKKFHDEDKYLCAICAAPSILGELGYLDGKKYTCFPGFQRGNGEYINTGSVIDGKVITGHSMGYTTPFAENIIRSLLNEDSVTAIQPGIKGL